MVRQNARRENIRSVVGRRSDGGAEGGRGRTGGIHEVPARAFFNILLQNTMEGYFADPIHGGNRNNAVWKMIGFPGAIGMYADDIEKYRNKKYDVEPKSIRDLS
jgi:gluconate 2-dehydrogenase gamma chain